MDNGSVITDEGTGQSRGFGVVEMPNREEATKAVGVLNGKNLKGRALNVSEAQAKTDRPRSGGGFGRH